MKNILSSVLFFFSILSFPQTKILSWNIENFGKSKSETQLNFIANTIKDYDIITIQEVVAGYGGAQSVAKLVEMLNQKGSKWGYQGSGAKVGDYAKRLDNLNRKKSIFLTPLN